MQPSKNHLLLQQLQELEEKIKIDYSPVHLFNMACTHLELGNHTKTIYCINESLKLNPSNGDAWNLLGKTHYEIGNFETAIDCCKTAILIDPEIAGVYNNLGMCYFAKNDLLRSVSNYLIELIRRPRSIETTLNLIYYMQFINEFEQAKLISEDFWNIHPKDKFTELESYILGKLWFFYEEECNWKKLPMIKDIVRQFIEKEFALGLNSMLSPFEAMYFYEDKKKYHETAISFSSTFKALNKKPFYDKTKKNISRKKIINIGYISPDFNNHPVGFLTGDMFKYHDRDRFKIHHYYLKKARDNMTDTHEKYSDVFRTVANNTHIEIADLIYKDDIDILIDLSGYTECARPHALVYQPAPIQGHFLGFTGTMGAEFIQYHLSHELAIPEEWAEFYSEKIVYLPDTMIACPKFEKPKVQVTRAMYGLPEDAFVFGCLSRLYRITEQHFDIWLNILKEVPNSVLWLSSKSEQTKDFVLENADSKGFSENRFFFKDFGIALSDDWHHTLMDLWLDGFRFTGGTASAICMASGQPLLTCLGDTEHSRTAAVYLNAMGAQELIAYSHQEYLEKAIYYAKHPEELKRLKNLLLKNAANSPLFDQEKFVGNLEKSYEAMILDYSNNTMKNKIPLWIK
ncbi:MAG: tetratricopeptide repeat protein [Gammaproteobacteria bacterium]